MQIKEIKQTDHLKHKRNKRNSHKSTCLGKKILKKGSWAFEINQNVIKTKIGKTIKN